MISLSPDRELLSGRVVAQSDKSISLRDIINDDDSRIVLSVTVRDDVSAIGPNQTISLPEETIEHLLAVYDADFSLSWARRNAIPAYKTITVQNGQIALSGSNKEASEVLGSNVNLTIPEGESGNPFFLSFSMSTGEPLWTVDANNLALTSFENHFTNADGNPKVVGHNNYLTEPWHSDVITINPNSVLNGSFAFSRSTHDEMGHNDMAQSIANRGMCLRPAV